MRMNEPESPGRVIPETLIMPQKKIKIRLSFSRAGLRKLIATPISSPSRPIEMVFRFQCSKSFEM